MRRCGRGAAEMVWPSTSKPSTRVTQQAAAPAKTGSISRCMDRMTAPLAMSWPPAMTYVFRPGAVVKEPYLKTRSERFGTSDRKSA